jgi:DNA-binding NtrC family response regulator
MGTDDMRETHVARILVIDDDASIRSLLRGLLEMQGYEVIEAENGSAGLRCYWAESPDLVITDMQMPVMDGMQLILELRRTCPRAKIIAMSGGQRTLNLARPLTQHAFEKPFQLRQMLAAIQDLVSVVETPALEHGTVAGAYTARVGV